MILLPDSRGRRLNKILCLSLAAAAALFLLLAGLMRLTGREEALSHVFFLLFLITGGFAAFYGLLWFFWARREKKAARLLAERDEQTRIPPDPARLSWEEFILPKEKLTAAARKRFQDIVRWTAILAPGMALLIGFFLWINKALESPWQLLSLMLFCLLVMLPGILIQGILYLRYSRSVPERITLAPGKLILDGELLPAGDIRDILVSSDQRANENSISLFRELVIRTAGRTLHRRIDFRSGGSRKEPIRWDEYPRFVAALADWGGQNGVEVRIDYMD